MGILFLIFPYRNNKLRMLAIQMMIYHRNGKTFRFILIGLKIITTVKVH